MGQQYDIVERAQPRVDGGLVLEHVETGSGEWRGSH